MWISPEPRYKTHPETLLVGRKERMSVLRNTTFELWQRFMPDSGSIPNRVGSDLYSVEVYDDLGYFQRFDPQKEFEKWAAVPVSVKGVIPEGMEAITLPEGQYAVFLYRGRPADVHKAYQYIYGTWLPGGGRLLDSRPHFAVMGSGYKGDHPGSEEEIWIPLKM